MKNPLHSAACMNLGLLLVRAPLGIYFALAGVGKFSHGVGNFVSSQLVNLPEFMPPALGKAYLYSVPGMEVLVGALLVIGFFSRLAGFLAALMLISFTIAVTGIHGSNGTPFHTNLILIGIALGVMFVGPGGLALDNMRFKGSSVRSKRED